MHHDAWQMEGYDALESIGSGSFGLIRKVRRKTDGKILARKEIDYRKMSTKEKEQLVAEVNILKDLKHPNIVEFLERVIDREHSFIYILMEYCEGGDLAAVIRRHKEKSVPIPEEFVWTIMTQLVLALHECHCGVIINEETNQPMPRLILHRDLKPDNVFLDAKKNVKLGDFGLSRSLTNPQKAFAQTYVGTPFYMSPELISDSVYDTKSDIWSLGCVVFEMCALEPPFLAETQIELSAKIKLGRIQTLPQQYSQELSMVVRAMLQVNPRRRPTTTDLLSNPRIRNTAIQLKRAAELADREERLSEREKNVKTKEEKASERETFLTNFERKCQAENQMLREKENALNSREESIRNAEISLSEWQKNLSWEQQQFDKRREVLHEQERRQSIAQKVSSSKQSEPATMDNGYSQEITTGKPNLFSAITTTLHPPSTAAATSSTNAGGSLERYLAARGLDNASDQTHVTRTVPRRKTGLSAGRYSLQTSNAYRSMASGSTNTNGGSSYNPASSSGALDQGGSYTNGQLAGNSGSNQKQGSNGPSSAPTENPSIAAKVQTQSYTYQGSNGKDARLSGRLSQLPSLGIGGSATSSSNADSQRLRGKSKSASNLIASMSSTSLSSTTPVPLSNPFLVPESAKASTSATSTASIFSSTAPRHNLTSSFNFTPPTAFPVTSSSANGLVSTTIDVQMSETPESSSQQSAAASGGVNYSRPPSSSNVLSGRNLTFHSPSNVPSSSALTSSSVINGYSARRLHASGTIGHIRFNPAPASAASTVNSGLAATAAISTSGLATISSGGPSLATVTAAATTTATSTAQSSSTTPSRPQSTKFGDENYNRNGTPERSIRPEEEDLRMEWDDDLPSPFIKKTYSRPPSSGIGGTSLSRNLLGA